MIASNKKNTIESYIKFMDSEVMKNNIVDFIFKL